MALFPDRSLAAADALGLLPGCGWIVIGAALGAIVGSFLATLVVRWPAGLALGGRSRCDGCGTILSAASLVPLLSFALQRARCRRCGGAIDPRHLIVELAAAAIGGTAMALAPGAAGLAGALFGWLLVALAILDLEHFWLPDRLTLAVAVTGLGAGLAGLSPSLGSRLLGGIGGYAALALIAFGYARLRGRVGLGQGDPKLLGAIGLWLGWAALPLVLLGASLVGLGVVAVRMVAGRPVSGKDRLPLGTLMAIAAWAIWCVGTFELPMTDLFLSR